MLIKCGKVNVVIIMNKKIKEYAKKQILKTAKLAGGPISWFGIYEPKKPDCLKVKNESTHKKNN